MRFRHIPLLVLFFSAATISAQDSAAPLPEYDIKSKLIFNIIRFSTWELPNGHQNEPELIVAVLGNDPFGPYIDRFDNTRLTKSGVNYRIVVRRVDHIDDLEKCHVLFLSPSLEAEIKTVLKEYDGKRIITIGESSGFLEKGGIVNFVKSNQQVRFEINLKHARELGIDISSRVLRLAVRTLDP